MPIDSGNLALKGLDDLFSTEENRQEEQREQVQQIPIDALHPFINHPFKVLDDEAMTRTVESIAQYGVLAPLIARPRPEGGYEIISGHRRQYEALLFAVQTGISSELTAGEQLRAKLVAHEENACDFVSVTEDTGVRFALDGIRAPWKIYCIRSAYYIYKSYGASLYREMLSVLVDAWGGDSDSFLSGILHGMARFLALYQGEYSRERLILRLRTVHPKTITRLAQNDTGNVADRHMKQILSIYNGAGRTHNLPCKR